MVNVDGENALQQQRGETVTVKFEFCTHSRASQSRLSRTSITPLSSTSRAGSEQMQLVRLQEQGLESKGTTKALERVTESIAKCKKAVLLVGAGISTTAGIPVGPTMPCVARLCGS